jgi:hypothetical protein
MLQLLIRLDYKAEDNDQAEAQLDPLGDGQLYRKRKLAAQYASSDPHFTSPIPAGHRTGRGNAIRGARGGPRHRPAPYGQDLYIPARAGFFGTEANRTPIDDDLKSPP